MSTEPNTAPAATAPVATENKPDPVIGGLMASILGLSPKAEEKPAEAPKPEEKKVEEKPAEAPKPEEKKPVVVRKPAPRVAPELDTGKIEEVVRRVQKESAPKEEKPPVQPPPAPAAQDMALTPEENEELELAKFLEAKDPTKKGLSDRLKKFYVEQQKFLEKKIEAEGDDYDPSSDPDFKKFLAKHDPKFTAADRRAAREGRLIDETEKRTAERVQKQTDPRIERLEREIVETRERPVIQAKLAKQMSGVTEGLPQEIARFHAQNGYDEAKTRQEYPEFDVVNQVLSGFERVSSTYLELKRGLAGYDPNNRAHTYVSQIINDQANKLLATNRDEYLVRGGKRFVHPARYNPADQSTWTFTEDDCLQLFRHQAKTELVARVREKQEEAERLIGAKQRRAKALEGAKTPPVIPEASPRAAAVSTSAGTSSAAASPQHTLASMLGI